jgi:DNA-binding PadR family transcriptional regulator
LPNDCQPPDKPEVLRDLLVLVVLRILDTMKPRHDWGIARRIERTGGDALHY